MIIDIRRALEVITPDAKWDYSIPNEGGTELQYSNIRWEDSRQKPSWATLVSIAEGFAAADLQARREGTECGALQIRRALRQLGLFTTITDWVAMQDEEIQEAWEYATTFKRLDPFILAAITALGKTDEEADALFALAATL